MVSESVSPPTLRNAFLPVEDLDPSIDIPAGKLGPTLKGSLKKPRSRICFVQDNIELPNDDNVDNRKTRSIERKSIRWMDDHGEKLIEVKEFEPSSDSEESDNEDEELFTSCTCAIQ